MRITAYIDVDDSYNLYVDSSLLDDFGGEGIEDVELDGIAYQDNAVIAYGSDPSDPAEVGGNIGTVAPGHQYTMEADGYICVSDGDDDGGGDDDNCDYNGTSASVYVQSPPPLITGISPSSVSQNDQGTLTVTGSNFIENSGDQLTLNFSGGNNPFTLTGAPSTCTASCTATFSYNFSGYPPGTYTLSVSNNEGESDYESFTVSTASTTQPSQTFPPDACAITSNSKVGYTSIVANGTASSGGVLSVVFSGTTFARVNPSIAYGPSSTPASIASGLAAVISSKYLQYGLSAKAFGPDIIYEGVAPIGTVSHSFTDTSFSTSNSSTVASATAAACYALPSIPCLGLFPDYDYTRNNPYTDGSTTPRQHIINKHILGTPSVTPKNSVYVNPGGYSTDAMFDLVKAYNFTTVLLNPTPVSGVFQHTFTKTVQPTPTGTVEKGWIGIDGSGNDLYTNNLYLSTDRCRVNTSYPVAP